MKRKKSPVNDQSQSPQKQSKIESAMLECEEKKPLKTMIAHQIMQSLPESPTMQPFNVKIKNRCRIILVCWLTQICIEWNWNRRILHSGITYVDLYMTRQGETILLSTYQLLGICCLWISAKFHHQESEAAANLERLVEICDGTYTLSEMKEMERKILVALEWRLAIPSLFIFTESYCHLHQFDQERKELAFRMCDQWTLLPQKCVLGYRAALQALDNAETLLDVFSEPENPEPGTAYLPCYDIERMEEVLKK